MSGELTGKVALVTGAGAGIGEACARRLAQAGARVALADVNLESARRVASEIGGDGRTVALEADVADPAAVEEMVASTVRELGGLHVAVNNAGIGGERAPTGEYGLDSWRTVLSVNLDGVFYCTRAEIRTMRERGGGSIVNIASVLGSVAFPHSVAYVAAKHGVVGLSQTAALEHAADSIRVNAVAPGFIATPLLKSSLGADEQAAVAALHPMNRLGEPSEVAELVLWLASDASSFATGGFYAIDGGYLAR